MKTSSPINNAMLSQLVIMEHFLHDMLGNPRCFSPCSIIFSIVAPHDTLDYIAENKNAFVGMQYVSLLQKSRMVRVVCVC